MKTLQLRRPKSGGQVEGVVSIPGIVPYTEIFGNIDEARAFATANELEVREPPEDNDELPEGTQGNSGSGQPRQRRRRS